jgi:hypothetical protein
VNVVAVVLLFAFAGAALDEMPLPMSTAIVILAIVARFVI